MVRSVTSTVDSVNSSEVLTAMLAVPLEPHRRLPPPMASNSPSELPAGKKRMIAEPSSSTCRVVEPWLAAPHVSTWRSPSTKSTPTSESSVASPASVTSPPSTNIPEPPFTPPCPVVRESPVMKQSWPQSTPVFHPENVSPLAVMSAHSTSMPTDC